VLDFEWRVGEYIPLLLKAVLTEGHDEPVDRSEEGKVRKVLGR
jgi:hypothetical protein